MIESTLHICDKCKGFVPEDNSVVQRALRAGDLSMVTTPYDRHLYTVLDGDTLICEGSPSRVKRINEIEEKERDSTWEHELDLTCLD